MGDDSLSSTTNLSKVRLVRCPNCGNVFPEPSNYSMYHCGGCSAVLEARRKALALPLAPARTSENSVVGNFSDTETTGNSFDAIWRSTERTFGDIYVGMTRNGSSKPQESGLDTTGVWFDGCSRDSSGITTCAEQGSSSHEPDASFANSKPSKSNHANLGGLAGGENLELDRACLLMRLGELKHEISRICGAPAGTSESIPPDREVTLPMPVVDHRFAYDVATRSTTTENVVLEHPDVKHHGFCIPSASRSSIDVHGSYMPPINAPRVPLWNQYGRPSRCNDSLNKHGDLYENPSTPCLRDSFLHHSYCACFICYSKHHQLVPPQVRRTSFGTSRILNFPANSNLSNPFQIRPQEGILLGARPPYVVSHNPHAHQTWLNDHDSGITSIVTSQRKSINLSHKNKKRLYPISGGAPFVTCCNCFELLNLPPKLCKKKVPNKQKLCCAVCLTILLIKVDNGRISSSIMSKSFSPDESGYHKIAMEEKESLHGPSIVDRTKSSGDDSVGNLYSPGHVNSNSNSQENAMEDASSHTNQEMTLNKYERSERLAPLPFSSDEVDVSLEEIVRRDLSYSADNAFKEEESKTISGSTFTEQQCLEECGIKALEHENLPCQRGSSEQDSAPETVLEAETDHSFDGYVNISSSRDSLDTNKGEEADLPKKKKRNEFFLLRLFKKRLSDSSGSNEILEIERHDVMVNEHWIPNHLVKKAERLAGPIRPGNFWYDFQGGFWGVMGQPCLGIIPPLIKEFNYPMRVDCAGGNTGIFVNGRELHQRDLELLACRGLPTEPNRRYRIEFSGRVYDEESGQELCKLGRLAPSVQRAKRGFGMKIPKSRIVYDMDEQAHE